ncbi:MAG TPA: hypothetical protein VGI60_17715 [Chthoniobacterales bacterium]|jgi:hypothetical protein
MKSSAATPRRILWSIGGIALLGAGFAFWLGGTFAGQPDPRTGYNAFYVLFARDEVWGLGLLALFCFAGAMWFFREKRIEPSEISAGKHNHLFVACIAAGVFAIAALGTEFVCHNYALSADEFMTNFQAQIFLRGEVTAEVPAKWLPALRVIKPTYVDYLPAKHAWKATYLPVYAAMRALFQSVYLQSFLNPFLAALTVLVLYATARNIWPNERQNALLAVFLLTGSAQFLVMAMTEYSMPAHLALNTIWLWLYSQPDRRRFYLAPVVGLLAIGLHQPIVHALFVAPFLLRLVWQRRWRPVVIFGIIYSLGCTFWCAWRLHYATPAGQDIGTFLHFINFKMIAIQPMDLLLVLGWSCLATPLLFVLGLRRIFRERPILQDAAFSCLLTFGFYYFFYLDQGHGWGYRYFHGTLSCLVLVAVAGWESLGEKVGSRRARNFLGLGVAISLLFALPLRCYEVETFVRPFARASHMIHSCDAQVVGLNPLDGWYSADLIRNDPFLEDTPIVAAAVPGWMSPAEVQTLGRAGKTRFIGRDELAAVGLATTPHNPKWMDPFHLGHAK